VFIWDVQTLTFVYMTFVVYGWFWFSFMVMCMDVCMDVFGYVFGVCVWVMCMDTGFRSSARPGSINIGAYLSLGPVSITIGTYSLLEARLNDSPNFSNFPRQKWKNLPQYAMSNKFF
jgi:hypothetical protein